MVYCVAFGCKYKHFEGSGISFHSFPAAGPTKKKKVHYCKCADFTCTIYRQTIYIYVPTILVIGNSLQYILKPRLNMDMRIIRPV